MGYGRILFSILLYILLGYYFIGQYLKTKKIYNLLTLAFFYVCFLSQRISEGNGSQTLQLVVDLAAFCLLASATITYFKSRKKSAKKNEA